MASIRTRVAHLVWLFCALCALILAAGALMIALDANQKNDLVAFVLRAADAVDMGVFSRRTASSSSGGRGPRSRTRSSTGASAPWPGWSSAACSSASSSRDTARRALLRTPSLTASL